MKVYDGSVWLAAYVSGSGFLAAANNLSDVASTSAARANLGLGSANNVTFATVNGVRVGTGNVSSNTVLGVSALAANTTGSYNTGVGKDAIAANTTGSSNTALGNNALGANTTGSFNTAVGVGAGSAITTGTLNTIIGAYSGNAGGLDIRTATNYTVLSDGDGNLRQVFNDSGAMGLNGANYGSSGQVLTSQGSSAAPQWQTMADPVAMALVFGG
jgi:hypothetical protein